MICVFNFIVSQLNLNIGVSYLTKQPVSAYFELLSYQNHSDINNWLSF